MTIEHHFSHVMLRKRIYYSIDNEEYIIYSFRASWQRRSTSPGAETCPQPDQDLFHLVFRGIGQHVEVEGSPFSQVSESNARSEAL